MSLLMENLREIVSMMDEVPILRDQVAILSGEARTLERNLSKKVNTIKELEIEISALKSEIQEYKHTEAARRLHAKSE